MAIEFDTDLNAPARTRIDMDRTEKFGLAFIAAIIVMGVLALAVAHVFWVFGSLMLAVFASIGALITDL